MWHLPEPWWICIHRWCVYLWVSIYLFSGAETLTVLSAPMSISGATEAQWRYILSNFPNNTLCCISYCQINQTWSIILSQLVTGDILYRRISLVTCLPLWELREGLRNQGYVFILPSVKRYPSAISTVHWITARDLPYAFLICGNWYSLETSDVQQK